MGIALLLGACPESRSGDERSAVEYRWTSHELGELNRIDGSLLSGEHAVRVRIEYPAWKTVLCDNGRWREGVPYEHVYDGGPYFGDPRVLPGQWEVLKDGAQTDVRGLTGARLQRRRGGSALLGGYHDRDVLFAFESTTLGGERLKALAESFLVREDTLGRGVVPRLEVEQRIQGRWLPLTRYGDGLFFYRVAVEDTIRLRLRAAICDVVYLRDHAEIRPLPAGSHDGWTWRFGRRLDEVPSAVLAIFAGARCAADSTLEVAFPWGHLWELTGLKCHFDGPDIMDQWLSWYLPAGGPDVRKSLDADVNLAWTLERFPWTGGPDSANCRNPVARWPLRPTVAGLQAGDRAPLGFPGLGELPDWYVQRLQELKLVAAPREGR